MEIDMPMPDLTRAEVEALLRSTLGHPVPEDKTWWENQVDQGVRIAQVQSSRCAALFQKEQSKYTDILAVLYCVVRLNHPLSVFVSHASLLKVLERRLDLRIEVIPTFMGQMYEIRAVPLEGETP